MKIGLFVNDLSTEHEHYATTCLARAAHARGHDVWYIGVEDFIYDPDERLRAHARTVPSGSYDNNVAFLAALRDSDTLSERIAVSELDVLLLRNNPAEDYADRPWAQSVGVTFGQMAARRGVIVLNEPFHLANALNKLYFQYFPKEVRPVTLITRDRDDVHAFLEEQGGQIVLKPLRGSGGQGVFMVRPEEKANLNQIIEAIGRDGYIVAQEFLPAAAEGDVRLFLMNGLPLEVDGHYAAFQRVSTSEDLRSNIHAGGEAQPAEVTDRMLEIAEIVRPKLMQDGMFLVGLDIAGDKLMEVNVFSPGGLYSMERFEEVDFSGPIIEAIEHKVAVARRYAGDFSNVRLATM